MRHEQRLGMPRTQKGCSETPPFLVGAVWESLVPNAAVEQPTSLSWLMPVKVSAVWPHQSQSSQRSLAGIYWVAACSAAEHEMAADSKQEVALAAGIPVHDGHEANVDCAVKATRIAPAKPVELPWLMPVRASAVWQHLPRSSLKPLTDISEMAACSAAEHEIAADSTLGVALTAGIPEQESNEAGAGAAVKATRKAPAKQARCFAVLEAVVSSDCVVLGGAKELLVTARSVSASALPSSATERELLSRNTSPSSTCRLHSTSASGSAHHSAFGNGRVFPRATAQNPCLVISKRCQPGAARLQPGAAYVSQLLPQLWPYGPALLQQSRCLDRGA